MRLALEIDSFDEWTSRLDVFLEPKVPTGIMDKIKMLPELCRYRDS